MNAKENKIICIMRTVIAILFICVYIMIVGIITILINFFTGREGVFFSAGRFAIKVALRIVGVDVVSAGFSHNALYSSCLFISNHQSNLDPAILSIIPPVNIKFLPKRQVFYIPVLSYVLRKAGFVPIDRENKVGAMRSLVTVVKRLKQGDSYCIFPEGTRSPSGKLQEFKRGAFMLAVRSHCTIVPVFIKGSYDLMPKGKWYINPGTIRIKIFPQIHVDGNKAEDLIKLQNEIYNVFIKEEEKGDCI